MLEIRDLRVVYPNGFEALKAVSFSVADGEIVALIGRSGAGKSTILRCINGLQPITAGHVLLRGVDISQLSQAEMRLLRRKIGFIWQEYNLVNRLTVMKNVLSGRLGYANPFLSCCHWFDGDHRKLAVESLERVNILHRATQRADRLSGGEKQRVAIARALAQEPELILADEPVASLDVELSRQVMSDLVRVSRQQGVPTVISIHDVELARTFCDRLIGLAQGSVVFDGPTAALTMDVLNRVYRFDRPIHLPVTGRPGAVAGVGA